MPDQADSIRTEKELRLFYLHHFLFSTGELTFGILIPIYLYQYFGNLSETFLCYTGYWILVGLLLMPTLWVSTRVKAISYGMIISIVFYCFDLLALIAIPHYGLKAIITWCILHALYIAWYWPPRQVLFTGLTNRHRVGRQVSFILILNTALSVVAPLLGAWVAYTYGFEYTFHLGLFFIVLSIVPLFFIRFQAKKPVEIHQFQRRLHSPHLKHAREIYLMEGMFIVLFAGCWVFAFNLYVGSVLDLGMTVSIAAALSGIMSFFAGHSFDKGRRVLVLRRTTLARTIITILFSAVPFAPKLAFVALIDACNRFVTSAHQTVTDAYLYDLSSKTDPLTFHITREMALLRCRIYGFGFLSGFFAFMPNEYLWVFVAVGGSALLGWLWLPRLQQLIEDADL